MLPPYKKVRPARFGPMRLRGDRRARQLRPSLQPLEQRVVLALTFPSITGVTFDASGDVFVSYDSSTVFSGQQQSVAKVSPNGTLVNANLFGTTGTSAFPGVLTTVSASDTLPKVATNNILELQPDGELFDFNPVTGAGASYDVLSNYTPNASNVYDVQTGKSTNLSSQINLSTATFGDFGVYGSSLVVSAESNNWDFILRVTYNASGVGTATVLVASPTSGGLSSSPGGVAVDSQGTVLTTVPYVPAGGAAIHVAVGFNLFFDQGQSPQPTIPNLGLQTQSDIDSTGITVDSQNNFILVLNTSSLYGGGSGVAHINSALTAFLADPIVGTPGTPYGIAFQDVGGTNYLAITTPSQGTYTLAYELSLFSGQVSPAQLRHAYGIDQISFPGPNGTTVTGDGTGQTIAIVEEGEDPTLAADLTTFDQYFGIPAPPSLQIINQNGVATPNLDIVGEASLDVEWAHAIAPGASIIIYNSQYNANNSTLSTQNLLNAIHQASLLPGVSVVSLSYGIPENGLASNGLNQQTLDASFKTAGVTFVSASGDTGIYGGGGSQVVADYPASSPNMLAVGGTSITIDANGNYPGTGSSGEIGWGAGTQSGQSGSIGGSGGGLSSVESEPSYQSQSGVVSSSIDSTGKRAVPDVAIDSGSAQPYDVFTSTVGLSSVDANPAVGWLGDAGTSAAAPIWAGLIAIADQGRALRGGTPLTGYSQTLPALYALPATDFHDIVNGNNGDPAGVGYDLVTGRGSPVANLLVSDLAGYQLPAQLTFSTEPPASVGAGQTFTVTVKVQDSLGNAITSGNVTIALANNSGNVTLGGTLTEPVVNGLASFPNLSISQPDTGYSLTASDATVSTAQPSTSIDVTSGTIATQIVVQTNPLAPVFGQPVTISATVEPLTQGSGTPTGTVTFNQGSTVLGTATLNNGVASISITPSAAGTESITINYAGSGSDQPSSVLDSLTVGQAAATLALSNLSDTYNGSAQFASASTTPAGLSGVSIAYSQNGVTVASPTQAGSYTVTATLDNANYTATPVTGTLVIGQATPTITWSNPADITQGTALGSSQLDASASVPGTFAYTPSSGTVLSAGAGQTLSVTFTPSDSTDYSAVSATAKINVLSNTRTSPTVTWTNPGDIVFGTALGASQLDASASVPGTFVYTPAAGTVLAAGQGQTLSVTFTPTDTVDYNSVTTTATINVNQAVPTVTWSKPADITQGTALGASQLDATASVPGTFVYTPAAGTVLGVGTGQTLSATFTPTDATDYKTVTATTTINVLSPVKTTPTVTWTNPGAIVYGTALSASQLDATASVPGTFAYSPPLGTVLGAGQNQVLSVTFTPNDTTDYNTVTSSTTINVEQATPTVSWTKPADIDYGTALGASQLNATASVPGIFSYTPALGTVLKAGLAQKLSVTFTPNDGIDYASVTISTTINVQQATPTVTWPSPADIVFGTPLGASQLDASASVAGTFTYNPPSGTVMGIGPRQTLSVEFTPSDTTDYTTVTATTMLNVDAPVSLGIPNAPVLSATSDTGSSTTDGITRDDGSAGAPLTFTVSNVSPPNAFVQLYDVTNGVSVALGSPTQAQNGTATITLSGTPLTDGTHQIAATAALTLGGSQSLMSAATSVTVQTALRVTSVTPNLNYYNNTTQPLPNNGQVVVTFNHWLAGITVNATTGYASPAFSVMLIPAGPDALTTQASTGVLWSAPSGQDSGDLPVPATLKYHQNADGTSTLTLTPKQPLTTDVYLITVDGLSDLAGNPLENISGAPGNYFASFEYQALPANTSAPTVTSITAQQGTVVIANNQIAQPDTIGITFSKPMDPFTINTNTVQLFAQGDSIPLTASVAYSPSTQTAYLTPGTLLQPGTQYTITVSTGVTDDQRFPSPGQSLPGTYTDTFTVSNSAPNSDSTPLAVKNTAPLNGSPWFSALGYGSVTFNNPIVLSSFTRFSAMLVPQTGGVTTGSSGYADVPVDAKLAFNPNTNQLIIVPTGILPGSGTVYAFALSNIPAKNGSTLTGPYYSTFELASAAQPQVETRTGVAAEETVIPPVAPAKGSATSAVVPSPLAVQPRGTTISTRVSILTSPRKATPAGPLLIAKGTQRSL